MLSIGVLAICYMSSFATLPRSIKGEIVLRLKNHVTIAVRNKDRSQVVEMTFQNKHCKKIKGKANLHAKSNNN